MRPWKNLSINILFFGCRHFYHRWNFLSPDLSQNAPAWSVQHEHFFLRSPNVHKMKSITLNSLHKCIKNTDSFLLEATFKYTGTRLYPSISPCIIIYSLPYKFVISTNVPQCILSLQHNVAEDEEYYVRFKSQGSTRRIDSLTLYLCNDIIPLTLNRACMDHIPQAGKRVTIPLTRLFKSPLVISLKQ